VSLRIEVVSAESTLLLRRASESEMKAVQIDKMFNNFKWRQISRQGGDWWCLDRFPTQSKLFSMTGFSFCMDVEHDDKGRRELFQL